MRRCRQQLAPDQCLDILRRATAGTLAVLGDGDYPYAVPLSFVYHEGCIYFHSARTGHKIDAIQCHPKASFCVIDRDEVHAEQYTTHFVSVIAFGRICIVGDDRERVEAARMLGSKYNPGDEAGLQRELDKGLAHMAVMRLDIEHLTGKQAIELVPASTRPATT